MEQEPQPTQQPGYPQQPAEYPPQPSYPSYPSQQPYPQAPSYPQPAPQPVYAAPPQTMYVRSTSFTGKAVLAFFLYWLAYVPGLIFNVMFLNEANNVKKEIGRTPEGMGCLWATLIGSLVPLVLLFTLCASLGLFSALGGGHH